MKLERMTGFKPQVEFATGIQETIDWYKTHRSWWEAIRSGEFRHYYEKMYGAR